MNNVVETFWKSREVYPPVIHNYQRRYIDLGMVLKYTDGVSSISDLGCGEGQLILMLRELTNISKFYAYDLSINFIGNLLKRWGAAPGLATSVANFIESPKEKTDLSVCMGAILYVLKDEDLRTMLSTIDSEVFLCRIPCNLENRVEIDKFSEEFNSNYAAVYRTVSEYITILSEFFSIESVDRCYPDEIESVYGTKHYFFICKNRR